VDLLVCEWYGASNGGAILMVLDEAAIDNKIIGNLIEGICYVVLIIGRKGEARA